MPSNPVGSSGAVVSAALSVLIAAAAGSVALRSASAVPVPTVSGPIPATPPGDPGHDYPFYSSAFDLKARGYVEEEFFIEGAASRYTTPAQATGAVVDS